MNRTEQTRGLTEREVLEELAAKCGARNIDGMNTEELRIFTASYVLAREEDEGV